VHKQLEKQLPERKKYRRRKKKENEEKEKNIYTFFYL